MVPIAVAPSPLKTSNLTSTALFRVTSAIATPAEAEGLIVMERPRLAYVPLAGSPLTATMSARPM
jgi:hypothetical protein